LTKTPLIIVFHVSSWEAWSFVWGVEPTKAPPRGDGTEQTEDNI